MEEGLELNRASWDERAPAHAASPDYGFDRFASDADYISHGVRFDEVRLGDVRGLRGLHLQCHIGTDTVSLARLGAQMTGLDFSGASLAQASRLAVLAGADVTFVESNVYDAVDALRGGTFDFIFTGVGALCWLPDIRRWAEVVCGLLAPGGWLFIRDGHPMLGTIEDNADGQLVVEHSYFERPEPFVSEWDGTYVETATVFEHKVAHEWSHGIGEIVTALLDVGMQLTMLVEHDTVPWNAMPGQMLMVAANEWQLADRPWRVPHSFTLRAVKPA